MLILTYEFNALHGMYVLVAENCTDHEARQIFKHPAIDHTMTRFFNPRTGRLECWVRQDIADELNGIWYVLDWLKEDVLCRDESIRHDWSGYLDTLVE